MSKELSYSEFHKEAASWTDAFGPADHQQRKDFYDVIKKEFGRLRYLNIQRAVVTNKDRPMLDVLSEFRVSVRQLEYVKIDFGTVWSQHICGDEHIGAHFLDSSDTGFEFNFALRHKQGYCLVGRLQVHALRQ